MRKRFEHALPRIKMVLMDIDGTLITGASSSIDAVLQQLRRLRAYGIRFSVATGRTLSGAGRIIRQLLGLRVRLPPVIAYNGAVVAWPAESLLIHRSAIGSDDYDSALSICKSLALIPLVYICQARLDVSPVESVFIEPNIFYSPTLDFNEMPVQAIPDLSVLRREGVTAILAYCPFGHDKTPAVASKVASALKGKLRATTSGGSFIEIASAMSNKQTAMDVLARRIDIEPSAIMAIGDNLNDIEMIRSAGLGVAVANAHRDVKAIADYVCSREGPEGVVEVIRLLLGAIRSHRIRERASKKS